MPVTPATHHDYESYSELYPSATPRQLQNLRGYETAAATMACSMIVVFEFLNLAGRLRQGGP